MFLQTNFNLKNNNLKNIFYIKFYIIPTTKKTYFIVNVIVFTCEKWYNRAYEKLNQEVFILTERTIELVKSDLVNLYEKKEKLRLELEVNFNIIRNIFSTSILKPYLRTNRESTRSNLSIEFTNSCFSIYFRCTLVNKGKGVEIVESINYEENIAQVKNSNNNDSFSYLTKVANKISELKENLTEEVIFKVLTFTRNYLITERRYNKEINEFDDEMILLKKQVEVDKIKQIFVPIENFCINTFLCKKTNVEIKGSKPSRQEVSEMKELVSNFSHDFIVMYFKKSEMFFEKVTVKFYGKDLYVSYQNKTLPSLKSINEVLSQQITYRGELLTYKNKGFSKKLPCFNQYIDTSYSTSKDICEFINSKEVKIELVSITVDNF